MAWERLASTSADGSSTTLTTSTFTAKKNLRIIIHARSGAAGNYQVRFNADSGSNYATRRSYDGGSDGTYTSSNKFISYSATSALSSYMVLNITNISDQEKLVIGQSVENSAAGAGTAPNRVEFVGKWVNTSSQITSITILTNSGSNLTNDSYITVLGAKEEATADVITVDSLTAKKHLMIQAKIIPSGDADNILRFNNDSGNNYNRRRNEDGGSDGTAQQTGINWERDFTELGFVTIFVINEANKEKLAILHSITNNGNGAGNAPKRAEIVLKWANTSNAITRVDMVNSRSGSYAEGSEVTVYGTD